MRCAMGLKIVSPRPTIRPSVRPVDDFKMDVSCFISRRTQIAIETVERWREKMLDRQCRHLMFSRESTEQFSTVLELEADKASVCSWPIR